MSSVTFSTSVGGDGSTVTDDNDAGTGLGNGGHRTRFVPALSNTVNIAATAVNSAASASASANSAASSAESATQIALGGVYPAIRPTLNLDFANSQQVDSRITFARSSTATYFDANGQLQTAAINQPRIDFDPLTGECKGLLIEEQRTNACLYSRDLTNAAWTKTNCTTALTQTGIDGTTNSASLLTATAIDATCLQTLTLSSSARAQTAYVKRSFGAGQVSMTMDNGSTWTDITAQINSNTFTRVSIPSQTLANPTVGFKLADDTDAIIVDAVQNEDDAVPSSVIITTGSTVTRNAETAKIDGDHFNFYQQSKGCFVASYIASVSASVRYVFCASNASVQNRVQLYLQTNDASIFFIAESNVQQAAITGGTNIGTTNSQTAAYVLDDCATSMNGDTSVADSSCTMPSNCTQLAIGGNYLTTPTQQLNGHIRRLAYYPQRISNSEIEALSNE